MVHHPYLVLSRSMSFFGRLEEALHGIVVILFDTTTHVQDPSQIVESICMSLIRSLDVPLHGLAVVL